MHHCLEFVATLCQKESVLHLARSVSQSLIFMNVGLWSGGILVIYLVLLGAPLALFEYFRTPGLAALVKCILSESSLHLSSQHFVMFAFQFGLHLLRGMFFVSNPTVSRANDLAKVWFGKVD